jgi:hypothetical protein
MLIMKIEYARNEAVLFYDDLSMHKPSRFISEGTPQWALMLSRFIVVIAYVV